MPNNMVRCDCCSGENRLIMAEYVEKPGDSYLYIRHKYKGVLHTVKVKLTKEEVQKKIDS